MAVLGSLLGKLAMVWHVETGVKLSQYLTKLAKRSRKQEAVGSTASVLG